MAGGTNSFDDIKDFQKQLMQSFIDTALEAETEELFGYPTHEKVIKPNKHNGHTKKRLNHHWESHLWRWRRHRLVS